MPWKTGMDREISGSYFTWKKSQIWLSISLLANILLVGPVALLTNTLLSYSVVMGQSSLSLVVYSRLWLSKHSLLPQIAEICFLILLRNYLFSVQVFIFFVFAPQFSIYVNAPLPSLHWMFIWILSPRNFLWFSPVNSLFYRNVWYNLKKLFFFLWIYVLEFFLAENRTQIVSVLFGSIWFNIPKDGVEGIVRISVLGSLFYISGNISSHLCQ